MRRFTVGRMATPPHVKEGEVGVQKEPLHVNHQQGARRDVQPHFVLIVGVDLFIATVVALAPIFSEVTYGSAISIGESSLP